MRRTGKSRHFIYWLYFVPFIVIFIAFIVLDLLSSGFYLVDYFQTLGVNGLMRILEIRNTEEIRPVLEMVAISTRSFPSLIMFAATSKVLLFLVVNFICLFLFPKAAWHVSKENSQVIIFKKVRKVKPKQTRVREEEVEEPAEEEPTPTPHDVNLTVNHIEPGEDNQSRITSQPPFNPYLTTDSRKQETHF